ncbi:DUF1289 domain-containing protein [Psychrosphaera ytuae]|uniref:DUF1289 domain-containing protein n=1 Tax=Psychrosphaera ytuae TaxID=2820710 RepID=A0A975DA84_9GAMM|nr:DUF1289 domain-containing protein [Psychrosphaera ytuae]QTH63411.1 DUF1289 domain-containing protein [Psychrosphaera ytuae]
MSDEAKRQSPCIRQCCLDHNDVCIGCYRTMTEILAWTKMSSQKRNEVLILCRQRQNDCNKN